MHRLLAFCAFFATLAIAPASALAQPFPSKPVRVVVTVQPGNVGDTRMRQIAEKLGPLLGQSVIVDNRPGASGNIASEFVMRAPADGYTLLLGHTFNMTWNPALLKMPFEPVKVLTGVTMISKGPPLLVAHPSMPFNTVGEMITYARANPGKLNMGGTTAGTAHVALELLKQRTGVDITFVPYKAAGGQIITDAVSNVINVYFDYTITLQQLINTGRLKPLGVASTKRMAVWPNVPTFREAGFPGEFDIASWQGLYAPAGTPRDVLVRIATETAKVLNMPDIKASFESTGGEIGGDSPDQFHAFSVAEHVKWGKVIRDAGIRLD